MSKRYAFILHQTSLPDPFLVELSRGTGLTRSNLEFYKPNVVDCPTSINPIIRAFLADTLLFKKHRLLVKKTLTNLLLERREKIVSLALAQDRTVEAIISHEILEMLVHVASCRRTRKREKALLQLFEKCRLLRKKRHEEELHFGYPCLSDDVSRSMSELRYVASRFLPEYFALSKRK